jgi:aromatic-L-amino-acid decarboxylase
MKWDEFAQWGRQIADWGRDYHENLRDRPVRAQTRYGEIAAQLPKTAPEGPEAMEQIFGDFEKIVMPGMTHWQHPRFFAYFPANASPPSMLAEFLVTTLAAQCMLWQTSPAATEMETRMLEWLRDGIGLPDDFHGVIQDSASSATLAAVLVMRERATNWRGNEDGLHVQGQLRVYTSNEVHSSVDRAVWVSGIGRNNLVRIPTIGATRGMDARALAAAIKADLAAGMVPAGIVACTGGTGTGACDDIAAVVAVAKAEGLYCHVDAAWAGAGMICPEYRTLWTGIEGADSIVFNPHKWLGAQFDCSAHFIRDPEALVKTLAMRADYLLTTSDQDIIDYSEWSIPLGRRFRALKLWFLMRSYGMEGLRNRLRNHVNWAEDLAKKLRTHSAFEIVTEPVLSLFTFKLTGVDSDGQLAFVDRVNDDGRIYITQTRVDGDMVIRFQIGQFDCTEDDIDTGYDVLCELAEAS